MLRLYQIQRYRSECEVRHELHLTRIVDRLSARIVAAGVVDWQLVRAPRVCYIKQLPNLHSGRGICSCGRCSKQGIDVRPELRVVEEIGGLSREAEVISLSNFEILLESHVHIPSGGAAEVVVARLRIAVPEVIRKDFARGSYGASRKSVDVVLEEAASARRDHATIRQRHRRLSVVPMLQFFRYFQRNPRHSIRQIIQWVVDIQRAAISSTVRQWLDESTLCQEVSSKTPAAE